MKIGNFEVSDTGPLNPYNRGYLEGISAQENKTAKEVAALKGRITELESKATLSNEQRVALEALLDHDCRSHRCAHRTLLIEVVKKVLL